MPCLFCPAHQGLTKNVKSWQTLEVTETEWQDILMLLQPLLAMLMLMLMHSASMVVTLCDT